jgi:hypothetical protein
VDPDGSHDRLELVDVDDERVLASLERLDEMTDEELRDLVRHEDAPVVEAAEALIARRRSGEHNVL